jgi:hypothetical protein
VKISALQPRAPLQIYSTALSFDITHSKIYDATAMPHFEGLETLAKFSEQNSDRIEEQVTESKVEIYLGIN